MKAIFFSGWLYATQMNDPLFGSVSLQLNGLQTYDNSSMPYLATAGGNKGR